MLFRIFLGRIWRWFVVVGRRLISFYGFGYIVRCRRVFFSFALVARLVFLFFFLDG